MARNNRRSYHLEVCPGDGIQGPTDQEIANAVKGLPGGRPSFVVLGKKKNHFMQAGGSCAEGFQLQYQEYSVDGHWQHIDSNDVAGEIVIQALQWYAQDNDGWRNLPWRRVPMSETREVQQRVQAEVEEETRDVHIERLPETIGAGLIQYWLEELGLKPKSKRKRR